MSELEARTLLDAFEPPHEDVGHTAVLVTMSADVDVLETLMERFTGRNARERARLGRCFGTLMRDAGTWEDRRSLLEPGTVPGLHELAPRVDQGWPRLLHAKLALLGFSRRASEPPSWFRLVIVTGNFTRASMRNLLELAFVTEAGLENDAAPEVLADLSAAAKFVRALADDYFHSAVARTARRFSPIERFDDLVTRLSRLPAEAAPRFLHSLRAPLFSQIQRAVEEQVPNNRNLLLCGSGFFETSTEAEDPTVLDAIAKLPKLARNVQRALVVNPETSGQLRTWSERAEEQGWTGPVRAVDPSPAGRRLHAKYILLGRTNVQSRRTSVSGAYLYLGSGNLSRRGLMLPGSQGNIECGVFFRVEDSADADALFARLFWDRDANPVKPDEWRIVPSPEVAPTPPLVAPCPLSHAYIREDGSLALAWLPNAQGEVELAAGHQTQSIAVGSESLALPAGCAYRPS